MFEGTSKEAVGRRLRLTRDVFGLGQSDFCRRAGIAQNAYSQFETGRRMLTLESAIRLHESYFLTLDWLYLGDASGLKLSLADSITALKRQRCELR